MPGEGSPLAVITFSPNPLKDSLLILLLQSESFLSILYVQVS